MSAEHRGHGHHHDARSRRFDPARAQRLDDPERLRWLPPETVVAFVDAPRNGVVVDLGTGTGTYAIPFALRRPDCTVVGIDIEPAMLEYLRAKPNAERVRTGGPELLTELRGRVDRVFAINVLHELASEHLRELFAAVAPEGRIAFLDWNADVARPAGPPADRLYGPADARRHLTGFGFVVERTLELPYQYGLYGAVTTSS